MKSVDWADARVVVAGGAGFLGSHLVERLAASGARVVVVDDFCTGARTDLADLDGVELIEADICSWAGPDGPIDAILNFASPASPPQYTRLALHTLRTGSVGTERLLQLAERTGARFLQASTSEVYGTPVEHPQTEHYWGNVNPVGPRSMYDEAKRFAEALCTAWAPRGVRVRIARIFNTYGPAMASGDGRVVPDFVERASRGEPLAIYGDGSQTRSFCYVDDMVDGLLALAASDLEGPVNLGNPTETSIAALADLVLELTGSEAGVVHRPLPGDDPPRRRPDITRAREALGWEPKVTLREGLERTIVGQSTGTGSRGIAIRRAR